jgi:PIN domain nuclease of toxin-antitoxin system
MRYYVDTCVLKWLFEGNKRVKNIVYDIESYQGNYAVSMEVLKEFFSLLAFNKIKTNIDYDRLIKALNLWGVEICSFEKKHLKYLYNLPSFTVHTDPTDRNIIAHAIADKRVLISGDEHFPLYEKAGLKFLKI